MAPAFRPLWAQFSVVVATVAAATLVGWHLRPLVGDVAQFTVFYSAVAASAWYGGMLPGLMAIALSAAAAELLFIQTPDPWEDLRHLIRLVLFLAVAIFLSYVIARMQQARRRSDAATAAARASETQLRLVTDALPALISYVDSDRRYRLNNRAYLEWFGNDPASLAGKTVREVLGDEAYRHREPHLERAFRGEEVRFQAPTVHKDLGPRETEITYIPDRDGERVRGLFVLVQDITERKRTEDRLREETATVETINRTGQLLAAELDLQKLVQNVVDATTGLTGAKFGAFFYNVLNEKGESYSLYALSGAPREAFSKFPMPRNTPIFAPTFRGEGVVRSDDITRDPRYGQNRPYKGMPEGHLPVCSYLAVPVVSRSGEVLGGLFFGHAQAAMFDERDERIVVGIAAQAAVAIDNARLYQATRTSEERFRQLAENIGEVFYLSDARESRMLYISPAYEQVWGRSCRSLYLDPRSFLEAVHPEDRQRVLDSLQRQRNGQETQTEYRIVRPDGQVRWIWDRAFSIRDESGTVVRISGIAEDITSRKQAEVEREQLLGSERAARSDAERANRLKDEFLATLSHELRTPLNAILGWAQILRTSNEMDDIRQGLETIERSARAQAQIIEDLLDMSRIISGRIRLEVQPVWLSEVVGAALETVRPAAEAKRIRLSICGATAGIQVQGDPGRLQQVVWNLLSNAIKFTPPGGTVDVELARLDGQVSIAVTDTGAGIRPEFLPHVFERFRQADASTTRRHGGLGLGLAIVRHLVELHGGTVAVHSDGENRGARFQVLLPISPGAVGDYNGLAPGPSIQQLPPCAGLDAPDIRGLKVLVVDDEADGLALVGQVLESCGAQVQTAGSVDEAMRRLERFVPDVILSDIGMPERDGYELIRRIRRLDPDRGGRTPAAAMTAFARSEDRRRALHAGYQIHLPKPVEPSELVAVVASLAGRTVGRTSRDGKTRSDDR